MKLSQLGALYILHSLRLGWWPVSGAAVGSPGPPTACLEVWHAEAEKACKSIVECRRGELSLAQPRWEEYSL